MAGARIHEVFVANDGHRAAAVVEECGALLDGNDVDEVVLQAPIKHATRAVSVCELLRRRFKDLRVTSELRGIFNAQPGTDRRRSTVLEIRVARSDP